MWCKDSTCRSGWRVFCAFVFREELCGWGWLVWPPRTLQKLRLMSKNYSEGAREFVVLEM